MIESRELVHTKIQEHIARFWPRRQISSFSWTIGPIEKALPGFRVLVVAPHSKGEPWVYVSQGAWQVCSPNEDRCEFFLISPCDNVRHIETLAMVANFYADPKYRFHIGKVIDIGRPWAEGSAMRHLLVSLPFPYGPTFEWCRLSALDVIRFCWLLPITESESDFVSEHGLEAMEAKFDEFGIDYLDPMRRSVV